MLTGQSQCRFTSARRLKCRHAVPRVTLARRLLPGARDVIAHFIRGLAGGGGGGGKHHRQHVDVLVRHVDARSQVLDARPPVSDLPADVSVWFQPVTGALHTCISAHTHQRTASCH